MAPDVIKLAKLLATDPKALSELAMDRTSASYKAHLGLAKTMNDSLISTLQQTKFSLNIDEATSENHHKVLTILVSFFSPVEKKSVVHHLESISMITVNSESLHKELKAVLVKRDTPWSNVMSILMDSCNVMRGSKKLCGEFGGFVESLLASLFTDCKWSTDLREALRQICEILGITSTMPERYVPTRWLSVLDATTDTMRLMDAYVVFYYSFLKREDQPLYQHLCLEIYQKHATSVEARALIRGIQSKLRQKKMTPDGKERKDRILERLFIQRKKTLLIMSFYRSVMPLLKRYVLIFQSKEPLIHKLHDEQIQVLKDFLTCIMKPESLGNISPRLLSKLKVADESLHLPEKAIFFGDTAKKLIAKSHKNDSVISAFVGWAKSAYVKCGQYLQSCMPLNNKVLQHFSAIDPRARRTTPALTFMSNLPKLVTNVLSSVECSLFETEVRAFHVDDKLPEFADGMRLDTWWNAIFEGMNYPNLSKILMAVLSCFHGPQVEGSFSIMGTIMNKRTAKLNISTFSAIQSIKYELKSVSKTAVEYFVKKDPLTDCVDGLLVRNMRGAYKLYSQEQEEGRKRELERKTALNISKDALVSKLKHKEARAAHLRATLTELARRRVAENQEAHETVKNTKHGNRKRRNTISDDMTPTKQTKKSHKHKHTHKH